MKVDEVILASYEVKMLLLKDLSSRIPYSPKIKTLLVTTSKVVEVPVTRNLTADKVGSMDAWAKGGVPRHIYIPYLYPLSSMTEEQKEELVSKRLGYYQVFDGIGRRFFFKEGYELYDWLNKKHFDYRGLIEKSLAIDATNLGIYK